jgi:DNA phosphorothioation-associated putative methyltransferase
MDNYLALLKPLQLGKRLPQALYLHESCLGSLPREVATAVEQAREIACVAVGAFNVVKLALTQPKVSLLHYPRFFEDGFPSLGASWSVDLIRRRVVRKDYTGEANPPVLHRKEALLPPRHPARPQFEALTKRAEDLGLFEDVDLIGQYREWTERLARIGFREASNRLVPVEAQMLRPKPAAPTEVHRHRTALVRNALSTPMQALWRHGYLNGTHSIFDYGCGRGDDLRALAERAIQAGGWDPHFAPESRRTEADVVNLGFVLNVIEDVNERAEALRSAYSLARRLLVVAVLLEDRTAYERHRLFRDGVLTPRGTFQKYFHQGELRQYLETCLAREPIAVGPGIFFVFRDDLEEQRFLIDRERVRRPLFSVPRPPRARNAAPRPPRVRVARPSKWDPHKELLDLYWQRVVELGRPPEAGEFDRHDELDRDVATPGRVMRHLLSTKGAEGQKLLEAAREARMSDLLVYFALNLFERRRSFSSLPESVRRDVRAFWNSYAEVQSDASALLFSVGQSDKIRAACAKADADGAGRIVEDHALFVPTTYIPQLPALIRVLIGCAARLYGELEAVDLVKIHLESAKVSLMTYDALEEKAVPELVERVKIDLRNQEIRSFFYGEVGPSPRQPLYLKSRFVPTSFPRYEEQIAFDHALSGVGGLDLRGFGPDLSGFDAALRANGLRVDDFALVRAD